ncbi:hypothetical protein GGX14DRAFT_343851, partial [Mycena pura]
LNGEDIPWVQYYKYMGMWFNSTTRDIFRTHYEKKCAAAAYVSWKTVLGCDHYVGRGRLPPLVGCQLYYALIDCHLIHGYDVALDVDKTSMELLDSLNRVILHRILGVGKHSGIVQLYSELGIYPLHVRHTELAIWYLRYLLALPSTHLAHKALEEADRLCRKTKSSWLGDLAFVLGNLPFMAPTLPSLTNLTVNGCDSLIHQLRTRAKQWVADSIAGMVSLPLLHGRLEPQEKGAPRAIQLCRQHYLSRVLVTDHRLALTCLVCASFYFQGLHTDTSSFPFSQLSCRKCGMDVETPGHVFIQCRKARTVEARHELRVALLQDFQVVLPETHSREAMEEIICHLIFDWNTVIPMARFIYKVVRSWRGFGRRLSSMVGEIVPETEDGIILFGNPASSGNPTLPRTPTNCLFGNPSAITS